MRTRLEQFLFIFWLLFATQIVLAQDNKESKKQLRAENDFTKKTTDEIAKDLANPNTPLTSLKFKNQFRIYIGDLPGAKDQSSYIMLFQSTLPFPFRNGKTLWIRPSVPIIVGQPYYSNENFESKSGLGDIVFDFQYGDTEDNGFLWSIGVTGTVPTATSKELGQSWAAGPGFQLGKISKKYVGGAFINHQWGYSNSNNKNISLTTIQIFNVLLITGGWNVASAPIITYNYSSKQWEVPVNLAVGKTTKINARPWKFVIEINYYLTKYDIIGPQWMIGINIAPVVKNVFYRWLN